MRENVTVFKGRKVDMRPHYLDEDSWELVKHGTREILMVGTREQIMGEYDRINEEDQ